MSTLPTQNNNNKIIAPKRSFSFPFIEFRLTAIVIFLLILFFSESASAHKRNTVSIFTVKEHNLNDSIVGIGVSTLHKINNTHMGLSVSTSLSNGEVIDVAGDKQEYLAWEIGAKVGYFSTLFLYAEIGFDFGEMALQDRDEDTDYYRDSNRYNTNDEGYYYEGAGIDLRSNRNDYSNDIDAYVGVGTGVNLGHVQLSVYARYRQIDGEYWKAKNQKFTGVNASISF